MSTDKEKYFWGTSSRKDVDPGYCVFRRLDDGTSITVCNDLTKEQAKSISDKLNADYAEEWAKTTAGLIP